MITGKWIECFIKHNYLNFEVRYDGQRKQFAIWTGDTWFYANSVDEAAEAIAAMSQEGEHENYGS